MDKSESELLAEWDIVSSVYDTEQENGVSEKKTDEKNNSDDNEDRNVVKDEVQDRSETSSKGSEASESYPTSREVSIERNPEPTVDARVDEKATESDVRSNTPTAADTDAPKEVEIGNVTEKAISEETTDIDNKQPTEENIESKSEETVVVQTDKCAIADNEKIADEGSQTTESNTDRDNFADDEAESVPETGNECSNVNNSDDQGANNSLESSIEHIQIEQCARSFVQEVMPDVTEQENAAIESSSSDIDIIDENVEESVTSSFVHPLSLSITSSVDTSSLLTTSSEDDKKLTAEHKAEEIKVPEKTETFTEKSSPISEPSTDKSDATPSSYESLFRDTTPSESRSEGFRRGSQRPRAGTGMFARILEFIHGLSRTELSLLGAFTLSVYLTIVFNQINIFAVVQKEDVVSQMKKMIDELKLDNKLLKDQMLSEMKNDKVISSFEHQIKELRKENSKLNHMLHGVAQVLEEQKDSHNKKFEKREAEYITPFKKEINSLKDYINTLKFDNEELQKELVRIRYASYSQGGKDADSDKTRQKKEEAKPDATSAEEISLDINSLKKWNELISLLSKELGLSESEQLKGDKPRADTRNISWYWKVFVDEFKGTFKDLKANVTSVVSDYKKANEKAVSEIYKFVKDFFTVKEEESKQKLPPTGEESTQWKNVGDFIKDLKEKWTKIKDRIYTSDIKSFVNSFKKSETSEGSDAEKSKSTSSYDHMEQKKPTDTRFESERKHVKPEGESEEDPKWMFKRAELRAELRENEKEDKSDNWYLKKKKHASRYESEGRV